MATIERALSTRFDGADVYLNTPDSGHVYTLNQTIELTSRTSLFGGFDKDWVRDPLSGTPANPPTPIIVNRALAIDVRDFSTIWISRISVTANAPTDGKEHSYAIHAQDGAKLILDRVNAKGSDLTTDYVINSVDSDPFESASSHGVFAFNLDELKITESKIQAGNGLDGPRGAHGADSDPGIKGTKGSVNGGGAGGAGKDNGANGGKGGAGATNIVTCAAGKKGGTGGGGGGGAGGTAKSSLLVACKVSDGSSGKGGGNGGPGGAGDAAAVSREFDADGFFIPDHGGAGKSEGGGGKGGGGGGGAGINFRDGGGGGGAGPAGGGSGAGGSFALILHQVEFASITNSELISANGGRGGPGGLGGIPVWVEPVEPVERLDLLQVGTVGRAAKVVPAAVVVPAQVERADRPLVWSYSVGRLLRSVTPRSSLATPVMEVTLVSAPRIKGPEAGTTEC